MIRSSKHSLKYANNGKLEDVALFLKEYRRVTQLIIDRLWESGLSDFDFNIKKNKLEYLPTMLPSNYLHKFNSWFTARMMQCAGKQACSMLRSAVEKRRKQLYILRKLQKENLKSKVKKSTDNLQRQIDLYPLIKPNAAKINAELDERFTDFQSSILFGAFVRIKTIGDDLEIIVPIYHNKVSNKWISYKDSKLKKSIRLNDKFITLIYDIQDLPKKTEGLSVGADQGQITVLSLSDNQVTKENDHGYDLSKIQKILSRRKKGSKGFRRAQQHRKNYINWSINKLNFKGIKEVRFEKVKNLRFKKQWGRNASHWTYTLIKEKIQLLSETEGFSFIEVDNKFRSQRCSKCGWVHKESRKGKTFRCKSCGIAADADLNAASNLELDLFEIPEWVCFEKINLIGFYWKPEGLYDKGHEQIVRDSLKNEFL